MTIVPARKRPSRMGDGARSARGTAEVDHGALDPEQALRDPLVHMVNRAAEVLVVGAGPTGLLLALVLAKLGVRPRIVDAAEGPGTTSRALAVQARTLEIYRQLGLAKDVLDRGLVLGAVNLWRRCELAARVDLTSAGAGLSPYPFGIIFP